MPRPEITPEITYRLKVGEYEWSGMAFLHLDYGDRLVRADQIAHLERLATDGPGNRTKVHLTNRGSFSVPETMEEIVEKLRVAVEAMAGRP
jgi:hypothetical protein